MSAVASSSKHSHALRKELGFVSNLLKDARSMTDYITAARLASNLATKAKEAASKFSNKELPALTIRGLPSSKGWGWQEFRKWLLEQGCQGIRFAEKRSEDVLGVVYFTEDTFRAEAVLKLADCPAPAAEGAEGSSGVVKCEVGVAADAAPRHGTKRRPETDAPKAEDTKDRNICDAVCPLWKMPYPEQLQLKFDTVARALAKAKAEEEASAVNQRASGLGRYSNTNQKGGKNYNNRNHNPAKRAREGEGRPDPASLICPLQGILRSPLLENYRNKSEFTMGYDINEQPTVGFLLGAFVDGMTAVADPSPTRHTSRTALAMAAAAQEFLRTQSKLAVYDKRRQTGFWRLLLVREGRKGSTFIPVPATAEENGRAELAKAEVEGSTPPGPSQPSPLLQVTGDRPFAELAPWPYLCAPESSQPPEGATPLDAVFEAEAAAPNPDEVLVMVQANDKFVDKETGMAELSAMREFLRERCVSLGLNLTVFKIQWHSGVSNAAPLDAPVLSLPDEDAATAAGYIVDSLCDFKFRISPTAFFQVNSAATCVLYRLAGLWAAEGNAFTSSSSSLAADEALGQKGPKTLLLDVCCGTGTIGLTLAGQVDKVVGVDITSSAIQDAKVNAELNGVQNAEFLTGKAEVVLPEVLAKQAASYENIVAIVDPPRAGLHKSVLKALLRCPKISRVVYVSCNPDSLAENLKVLCDPAAVASGNAFVAEKAMALDLFPHTAHVETIVKLQRMY
eukprot:CAMPEP_0175047974 /NCGR_PEP_ID=MMETSP0052_2-20121109/5909_1 /TAXON_ID=51329 ORGANISM="Polytomella parva, Strain SAG 63-3" /NCGR_SAMPLE_ID=MMETSP0052_2 /ASSEMBLY_ACC=CAM_ASM_000194 /LENGTH=735 /DNA_ID=CAMNT_0016311941 /DNA_START=3 /DNA_END=2211 /DNA_ORIENTATION=+